MRAILVGVVCLAATGAARAEWKLIEVKKIWDQAPHNAFTDLVRFQDRWYCTFREGTGHAAGAGKLRVLVSTDGQKWESAALLTDDKIDLRDPKLSITPDHRLMMVAGAAVPPSRDPLTDHYSVVYFSKDGKEWTKPQRTLDGWHWLWRVTWHKGTAYGVVYTWDSKAPRDDKKRSAALHKSSDGVKWEKVVDFPSPNPSEATIAFDGDTMLWLQRRDGKPNTAQLGTSKAPYKDWTWRDLGAYYGGPNLIRLPDGTWAGGGRLMQDGKAQTVLCRIDAKEGTLKPALTLPSGGDNSYPGLVWHDGQLWVSYYSSHEGKTSIYLARVVPDVK